MPPGVWGHIEQTATNGAGRKRAQHPGWSGSGAATLSSLSAFIDTAAEFGALIDTLGEVDWALRTRVEGTVVRDLVEHLVGMERYLLGQLDRRPRLSATAARTTGPQPPRPRPTSGTRRTTWSPTCGGPKSST